MITLIQCPHQLALKGDVQLKLLHPAVGLVQQAL